MAVVLLLLALIGSWIAAIVDAGRTPVEAYEATRRNKSATVLLVAATGSIGALYYAIGIRPALRKAPVRPVVKTANDTQYCRDCDMSGFAADATRCTNCGSTRLAPAAARRPKRR